MKYYSEVTKKLYDSQTDLVKAETNLKNAEAIKAKKEAEMKGRRAEDAKRVSQALAKEREAKKYANEVLQDFVKKYGYYHTSFTLDDAEVKAIRDNVSENLNSFVDFMASLIN